MGKTEKALMVSSGIWLVVVVVCCLCSSCAEDSPPPCPRPGGELYFQYEAGSRLRRLDDNDTLYAEAYHDSLGLVEFVIYWEDVSVKEWVEVKGLIIGDAILETFADCKQEASGPDTVSFVCDLGWQGNFWLTTAHTDTSTVSGFSFRVCCQENGDCLDWSEPISFTVVDTLSR